MPAVIRALVALLFALLPGASLAANLTISTNGPIRQAGYGSPVTLRATVGGAPAGAPIVIRWTQATGPDVASTMQGADTAELRFVTRPLLDMLSDPPAVGVVPIPASATGTYVFEVTATAGTLTSRGLVEVQSAYASAGSRGIAVDTDVIVAGPGDQTAWLWTVEGRAYDARSSTVLRHADTRFPVVRLLVKDDLVVREELSGTEVKLYGGTWDGFEPCGRCHEPEHKRWQGTRHATVLERGLRGLLGRDYSDECLACHTLGWQPGVDNGGFDDVARRVRWRFPTSLGDAAAELPPELARLGAVECLSCHGPGRFTPSRVDVGMCAACHDRPPRYKTVAQWRTGPMARFRTPLDDAHPATVRPCTQCHSAQGFVQWMKGVAEPDPPFPRDAQPITCAACHDPHDARKPHQLRVFDRVTTLSGLEIEGAGAGALCMTCHNLADAARAPLDLAPLAPQADVYLGRMPIAGREVALPGAHADLRGTCVACHQSHAFTAGRSCEAEGCQGAGCHSEAACGENLARWVDGELARLDAVLTGELEREPVRCPDGRALVVKGVGHERERAVLLGDTGAALPACEPGGATPGPRAIGQRGERLGYAAALLRALRNDKSRGAHNPRWTKTALRAIELLLDHAPGG